MRLDKLLTTLRAEVQQVASAAPAARREVYRQRAQSAAENFQLIQRLSLEARAQCRTAGVPFGAADTILSQASELANDLLNYHADDRDRELARFSELMGRYRSVVQRLSELRPWCENESRSPGVSHPPTEQAEGTGAGSDPAEGKQAEVIDELVRQKAIAKLPRAIRRAFLAFEAVARKKEQRLEDLEDHEAHKLLKAEGVPDDADDRGELTDYEPSKSIATFRKYLSRARHALGEPKYTSRRGRAHGKSIAQQDQIELLDNDEE